MKTAFTGFLILFFAAALGVSYDVLRQRVTPPYTEEIQSAAGDSLGRLKC